MNRAFRFSLLFIIAFSFSTCKSNKPALQNVESSQHEATAQITAPSEVSQPEQTKKNDDEKSVYDLFVPKTQKNLSYNGYTIVKTSKKVLIKEENEKESVEVSYSIIKKGGKVIGKFAGLEGSLTASDFGLFDFLGGDKKQLILGQTLPHNGIFWIVTFHPVYRVLLRTKDYGNFREEPWIEDIDHDGIFEITMTLLDFYESGKAMNMMTSPQPSIIFKYDKQSEKYLPANPFFYAHDLHRIDEEIAGLKSDMKESNPADEAYYYRDRASILLSYVFAGKEKEGWAFFDKAYNLSDKEKIKAELKALLRKNGAYKFIYRREIKI